MMGFIRFLLHRDDNLVRMSMPTRPPWRIFGNYGRQLCFGAVLIVAVILFIEPGFLRVSRPFTWKDVNQVLLYFVIILYPIRGWLRFRRQGETNTA
jgi:hypothetical protein